MGVILSLVVCADCLYYINIMLNIRSARFQDNDFIKSVFEALLPLYADLLPGTFEDNMRNMDILTQKGYAFDACGLSGYIIEADQQAIGFAAIGLFTPQLGYLAALHFLPAFQRQGYGKKTLKELETRYRRQKLYELVFLVHYQADWAINFYTQLNYRLIAEERSSILQYAGPGIEHLLEPGLILMGKKL